MTCAFFSVADFTCFLSIIMDGIIIYLHLSLHCMQMFYFWDARHRLMCECEAPIRKHNLLSLESTLYANV